MQIYKKEYTNKEDGVTIPLDQNFTNALLDIKGNNDYRKIISESLIQSDPFLDLLYKSAKDGFNSVIFDFSMWLSERDYTIQQTENQKIVLCNYVTSKLNDILGLTVEYSIDDVEYSIDDDKDSTGNMIFNIMFKTRLIKSKVKIVKIKVGSRIEYSDGFEIIKDISINFYKSKTVFFESGEHDSLKMPLSDYVLSIDGVQVCDIESIEI